MALCLDTDVIIEFFRGNQNIALKLKLSIERNEQLFVTPITLCELFRGAYLSNNPEKELGRIRTLLETCLVLNFSSAACEKFGSISASLIKGGEMVHDADLLTGAIVLNNNYTLISNNTKHFSRIKDLKLENWAKR